MGCESHNNILTSSRPCSPTVLFVAAGCSCLLLVVAVYYWSQHDLQLKAGYFIPAHFQYPLTSLDFLMAFYISTKEFLKLLFWLFGQRLLDTLRDFWQALRFLPLLSPSQRCSR